jgi:hypothetical protein
MKSLVKLAGFALPLAFAAMAMCPRAQGQTPATVVPVILDTAVPIVVNAVKPKPTGLSKFEGYITNANVAQITVRAKGNDMAIQTFALSPQAATKMQAIVDKGGYQYGDKITVLYDPASLQVIKLKGKPSKAL